MSIPAVYYKKIKVLILIFPFLLCSCSKSDLSNLLPVPPYTGLLDNYTELSSAFEKINQKGYDKRLIDVLSSDIALSETILPAFGTNFSNSSTTGTDITGDLRQILFYLLNQTDADNTSVSTHETGYEINNTDYENNFYNYIDVLRTSNPGNIDDSLQILKKLISFSLSCPDIEVEMDDFIASLLKSSDDTIDGQSISYILTMLREPLGKTLLQSNNDIWIDSSSSFSTIVTNLADINETEDIHVGIGNAVRGMDALYSGINDILSSDESMRNDLLSLITETGRLFDSSIKGDFLFLFTTISNFFDSSILESGDPDVPTILQNLISDIEDHFTDEGDILFGDSDYKNDTTEEYINAELGETLRELWPSLQKLFIREKTLKDAGIESFNFQPEGKSIFEKAVTDLAKLDIEFMNYDIENSLLKHILYDGKGRVRFTLNEISADPDASNISYLDHIIYFFAEAGSFGYNDGGNTGEDYNGNSTGFNVHGHGDSTAGRLSLNDCLHNMTVPITGGNSLYSLFIDSPSESSVYRSKKYFTFSDRNNNQFYLGSDYPVNLLLSGMSAGDAGIPNGGKRFDTAPHITNTRYWPFDSTGTGELNTARWLIGWITRACWNGEGPYYYADSSAATEVIHGKLFHKFLRPKGGVYAYVHKTVTSEPSTWEYIYPSLDNEPDAIAEITVRPTFAEFSSTKDLTAGVSVGVAENWSLKVKLGTESFNIIFDYANSGGDGAYTQAEIVSRINSYLGAGVCSALTEDLNGDSTDEQYIQIITNKGLISLEDTTPGESDNALQKFITNDDNDFGTPPMDVAPNYGTMRNDMTFFKITGNTTVNIQIDNAASFDVTFTVGSDDGKWTSNEIVAQINASIPSGYEALEDGYGFIIKGTSTDYTVARVEITNKSGNGVQELFGGTGSSIVRYLSRENRYKEEWHTDYYMIYKSSFVQQGADRWIIDRTFTPDHWGGRIESASPITPSPSWKGRIESNAKAGCFWYREAVPEYSKSRECSSQEEAMFKNLQWLLNEKKLVYILPLFQDSLSVVNFLKIEANGIQGLSNAKKNANGNRFWTKETGDGESSQPGDIRIDAHIPVFCSAINEQSFYSNYLGTGLFIPDVLSANVDPLLRMGFLTSDADTISSSQAGIEGASWDKRNKLFPVFLAFMGSLRDQTYYETPISGSDYNNSSKNRNPLNIFTNSLVPILAKPMFYFQKETSTSVPNNCWKPRLPGSNLYTLPGIFAPERETYYLPRENRTLLSLLSEHNFKEGNGLIMHIAKTKILSALLSIMKKSGDELTGSMYSDNSETDENDYGTWGTRRKLFYGLEQLVTSLRSSKSESISRSFISLDHPLWFYTDSGNYRSEDMLLDNLIIETVGYNDSMDETYDGKGIAAFPDRRDDAYTDEYTWDDLRDRIEFIEGVVSPSSIFSITENLKNLIEYYGTDIVITNSQLRGLRHSLGSLFTYYDDTSSQWKYREEINMIITERLPALLEEYDGQYENILKLSEKMLVEGGIIEYLLLNVQSDYSSEVNLNQLYDFMGSPIFDSESSEYPIFWSDMDEYLDQLIDSVK